MLSALIPCQLGYRAMPLVGQPANHWLTLAGPLVLGQASLKPPGGGSRYGPTCLTQILLRIWTIPPSRLFLESGVLAKI